MTKGYLCTLAALCTAVCSFSAYAQGAANEAIDAPIEAASSQLQGSLDAARKRAAGPVVSRVSGWTVSVSSSLERAGVQAVRTAEEGPASWTIVADSIDGDRLISPRAIGTEAIVRGSSGRLVEGGAVIEDAVITTRKTTVRAARAELTLPNTVELTDVGTEVQRVE